MLRANVSTQLTLAALACATAGCPTAPLVPTDATEQGVDSYCQGDQCLPPGTGSHPGVSSGGGIPIGTSDAGLLLDVTGDTSSVYGQLFVTSSLPLSSDPRSLVATDGWLITSAVGAAMAVPETVTADGGTYSLDGVPVVSGVMVLRGDPPVGQELGVVLAHAPSPGASVNLIAAPRSVLEPAAINAGVALITGRAHLIVQVGDSPATTSGTTLDFADHTAAQVAYDSNVANVLTATPPTGPHGTAVAFNIAVPDSSVVYPRLTRGTNSTTYAVVVVADHVTWLFVPPP